MNAGLANEDSNILCTPICTSTSFCVQVSELLYINHHRMQNRLLLKNQKSYSKKASLSPTGRSRTVSLQHHSNSAGRFCDTEFTRLTTHALLLVWDYSSVIVACIHGVLLCSFYSCMECSCMYPPEIVKIWNADQTHYIPAWECLYCVKKITPHHFISAIVSVVHIVCVTKSKSEMNNFPPSLIPRPSSKEELKEGLPNVVQPHTMG